MKYLFLFVLILVSSLSDMVYAQDKTYKVHNLMPLFMEFWSEAEGLPTQQKFELFQKKIIQQNSHIYNGKIFGALKEDYGDQKRIAYFEAYFKKLESRMDHIRTLTDEVAQRLSFAEATFLSRFPDMTYSGDVYFLPSFGVFDGAVREIDGRPAMMLGVDSMSLLYGDDYEVLPIFHHEFFHLYHSQFLQFSSDDKLYHSLWREGLAVSVTKYLNPDASDTLLVLSDLRQQVTPKQKDIARHFLSVMDEGFGKWTKVYFSNGKDELVPPRAGYFIGHLVAEMILQEKSVPDTVALTGDTLREEIKKALTVLAE